MEGRLTDDQATGRWSSVPALLDHRAAERPDAVSICFGGRESTYEELRASTELSARRLRAAGVGPGDRVAILLREGCEEYVSLALGAMRLGAMCLAVNARNKAAELRYVLEHGEPAVLVYAAEFDGLVRTCGSAHRPRLVVLGADEEFDAAAAAVEPAEIAALSAAVTPDTPAILLYTSGTTADPKGCMLAQGALLAVGRNTAERLEFVPGDRMWTPMTMFHSGGWQVLMTALVGGGPFSHPGMFEPGLALRQLTEERVTLAFPAFELIWLAVLGHPDFPTADLSALRIVINVGVRERLLKMQEMLPGTTQVSSFGLTESCGSICIGSHTDPLERRLTTSGRPMRGVELRVVDPESGAELPAETPGELQFKSPSAFAGYYRDPEATAATRIEGGWVRTGDLACLLPDGTLQFRGRLKETLKVGGENASAPEIEGFLLTHPAVSVAAVVGVDDDRYGEVPAAFVQCVEGGEVDEQELIEFCLGQIASFKVPRYVRFVDSFPTTASEKIKKFALRERIEAELREQGVSEAPRVPRPT
jgi:fatty-acyl-CoA synthase